jgi:hypothetical protein
MMQLRYREQQLCNAAQLSATGVPDKHVKALAGLLGSCLHVSAYACPAA